MPLKSGEIPIAGPVRLQVRKTFEMTLNPSGKPLNLLNSNAGPSFSAARSVSAPTSKSRSTPSSRRSSLHFLEGFDIAAHIRDVWHCYPP